MAPAGKHWIWNLLSVASATLPAKRSAPPNRVSSDFGQLVAMRHLRVGAAWAMAGAEIAAAVPTVPALLNSVRRVMRGMLAFP
jgi:hypothetical protein